MADRVARELNGAKKALLAATAAASIAIPVLIGATAAPELRGQSAQAAQLRFQVVSVKSSPPGKSSLEVGGAGLIRYLPGGRLTAINASLKDLVVSAYRVQYWQISGGPKWFDADMMTTDDRYNIEATSKETSGPDQLRRMLQNLLADRFQLALHRDPREHATYALRVARTAANLQRVSVEKHDEPNIARAGGGQLVVDEMTMPELAVYLTGQIRTTVTDETGLNGVFKFRLVWTPEPFRLSGVGAPPNPEHPTGIDPNGPSLPTALREQLGLTLDTTKGVVDYLVIDHVERPSEN